MYLKLFAINVQAYRIKKDNTAQFKVYQPNCLLAFTSYLF